MSNDTMSNTAAPEARIFKYKLPFLSGNTDVVNIDMHKNATPIHVALQCGEIHVWALVNAAANKRPERFRMYATGQPIQNVNVLGMLMGATPRYVGTVHQGDLVWHVFHEPRADGIDALLGKVGAASQPQPQSEETANA